jgi:hypothetical protein
MMHGITMGSIKRWVFTMFARLLRHLFKYGNVCMALTPKNVFPFNQQFSYYGNQCHL